MALSDRPKISTAPGARPDPRFETVLQPSRGGHFPAPAKPVPGTPKRDEDGRGRGRLRGGAQ
ncbi:hypothetical protein [Streptomyces virginiae]|uniref:hypothetical protein n=1 Tax=Streptomyces virginiae TaxID=1961 RepID=UPI0036B70D05